MSEYFTSYEIIVAGSLVPRPFMATDVARVNNRSVWDENMLQVVIVKPI